MQKTQYKMPMHFRIDPKLAEQLREAPEKTEKNPSPPSMTTLLERGIELVLREQSKSKKRNG